MNNKPSPMATLYHGGRYIFTELVPDGGARLDALFHTVPALGELAVGVVYGHLHAPPASIRVCVKQCRLQQSSPRGWSPAAECALKDRLGLGVGAR
ncbi:hypothetical protein [Pseudomonas sp. H3_C08]